MEQEKIIQTVRKYSEKYKMFEQGDRILLGLSGGADSVCLFFVLLALKEKYHFEIKAVHIHHGIRGKEADEDASYVEKLCKKYGISHEILFRNIPKISREQKLSKEEAGRKVRYEEFKRIAQNEGFQKIAVAHHQDDQAETILFQLCRGSGLNGLTGIKPVSGKIIRPLLCVSRKEIEEYLKKLKIEWRDDSTNNSDEYTRNQVRNQALPLLEKAVNIKAREHIANSGRQLLEVENYIKKQAKDAYKRIASKTEEGIIFSLSLFEREDIVIQKELLKMGILSLGGLKDLTAKHIENMIDMAKERVGYTICLPNHRKAIRGYSRLILCVEPSKEESKSLEAIELKIGDTVPLPEANYVFMITWDERQLLSLRETFKKKEENTYTKWFDYDKIKDNLQLRTRKQGDYILLENGKKKKLNRYLIDEKVPSHLRDGLTLLADGHHILWVLGYRSSAGAKLTEESAHIIKAQICCLDRENMTDFYCGE